MHEALGARIKEARLARNWSQQELADRVRVSQPTIVHWEQGTHAPRHLALARLSDTLGVSRDWLTGRSGGETRSAAPARLDGQAPAERTGDAAAAADADARAMEPADHDYLRRALRHVPVHAWPASLEEWRATVAGRRAPIDHLAYSRPATAPLALTGPDAGLRASMGDDAILIVDLGRRELEEGAIHLFAHDDAVIARRWRNNPARLEADTLEHTVFVDAPPASLGRVTAMVRHL
jgi:transcriptional regulator with XRE-family HTH domain